MKTYETKLKKYLIREIIKMKKEDIPAEKIIDVCFNILVSEGCISNVLSKEELSQKINRKMRVMTIFSAILLPVSLYIGILSVAIPLSHNPQEFWMHLAVMFMLSFVTFLFFKFSKWL